MTKLGDNVTFKLGTNEVKGTLESVRDTEERGIEFLVEVATLNGKEQPPTTVVTVTPDTLNQYGDYIE